MTKEFPRFKYQCHRRTNSLDKSAATGNPCEWSGGRTSLKPYVLYAKHHGTGVMSDKWKSSTCRDAVCSGEFPGGTSRPSFVGHPEPTTKPLWDGKNGDGNGIWGSPREE